MFDRNDGVVTICEIKYSDKLFPIDKKCAKELAQKVDAVEEHYSPDKQIFVSNEFNSTCCCIVLELA